MRRDRVAAGIGFVAGLAFLAVLRGIDEWKQIASWPASARTAMFVWTPVSFALGGYVYALWTPGDDRAALRDYGKWCSALAVAFGSSSLVSAVVERSVSTVVFSLGAGVAAGLAIALTSRQMRHEMTSE